MPKLGETKNQWGKTYVWAEDPETKKGYWKLGEYKYPGWGEEYWKPKPGEEGTLINPAGGTKRVVRYGEGAGEKEIMGGLDITVPTEEEEEAIKEQQRTAVQEQIDAINAMYGRLITGEEKKGKEEQGKTRALMSYAGLLGMPRGEAQAEKVKGYTREQVGLLESERAVRVAGILDKVDTRALAEIEAKRKEALGNLGVYMDYLKSVQTEARADIKSIALSGVSLDRLKVAESEEGASYYDQLLEETGWSSFVFDANYNLNLPQPLTYTGYWKGNNYVQMATDPATGMIDPTKTQTYTAEELGIPLEEIGKDIGFITNEISGEMFWFDKSNPQFDTEGNLVMKSLGKMKKPEVGEEEKGFAFSSDDKGRLAIVGFSNEDINHLEKGIKNYGWEEIKNKEKEAGMTDEQTSVLEQILKGITPTQAGKEAEETEITWEDQELKDYIKSQFKEKVSLSSLKGLINRDKEMTEADKSRATEILNEIIPTEWQEKIEADPDKYEIRDDGIYEKIGFWTLRPSQWKIVYPFE